MQLVNDLKPLEQCLKIAVEWLEETLGGLIRFAWAFVIDVGSICKIEETFSQGKRLWFGEPSAEFA
jgi:hypothetical protein